MIQHPIELYYDIALSRMFFYISNSQALEILLIDDYAFTKGKIKVL